MPTIAKHASFLLPEDILIELNRLFPKEEQSNVVADAIRKELKRIKTEKTLRGSFSAWKDNYHPELKLGVKSYIRKTRKSSRLKSLHRS